MAIEFGITIPTLRIFDEAKAREFYLDFLGFEVQFEHRFGDDFPLFLGVRRGGCTLHLSEHHGDGTPGTHVAIRVDGLEEYQQVLLARQYKHARPGLEEQEWGDRTMSIADPFGNRLMFFEPLAGKAAGEGAG